jgi:hypothetical protein
VSTDTIGVQFKPIHTIYHISFVHLESRASKIYDTTNRGTVDVKWQELDFTHLLSSTFKCVLRIVEIAVFRPPIATNRITILRVATDKSLNLRADHHRVDMATFIPRLSVRSLAIRSSLESGLPRGYSCCGKPQYLTAEVCK